MNPNVVYDIVELQVKWRGLHDSRSWKKGCRFYITKSSW